MKFKMPVDLFAALQQRWPRHVQVSQDFYFLFFVPAGLFVTLVATVILARWDSSNSASSALIASFNIAMGLGLWVLGVPRNWAYVVLHTGLLALLTYLAWIGAGLLSPALTWLIVLLLPPYFILPHRISHSLLLASMALVLGLFAAQVQGALSPASITEVSALLPTLLTLLALHITVGFMALVYDLQNQNFLQEIRQHNNELEERAVELHKANIHKDRFLAMVSHDMRTPLNGVMGYLSLIHTQTELADDTRQYVHQANTSAKHLLAVINDLLDLSQSRAGNLAIHPTVVNLPQTLQWVFETPMPQALETGLDYTLQLHNDLPEWVRMDGNRFAQILINLLGNAVKFTRKGHVRLFVKTSPIPNQPNKVLFQAEIDDTGMGIAPDQLKAIFDPFVQIQLSEDDVNYLKPHTGSGLGLTISRNLAHAMDGDIVASSVLGQGSTFVVRLTLELAQAPQQTTPSLNLHTPTTSQSVRLLVVDDNPVNRKVLNTTLSRSFAHAHIDEAENGTRAIEQMTQHLYDAVIMDLVMPDLDGAEVVRRVRAHLPEPFRSVPVLGLTANLAADALEACKQAGMDDVMGKPFDRQELLRVLQKWIDRPASV
jgi:signal transduction histidine kinase/CheY-like chemotaxis protein